MVISERHLKQFLSVYAAVLLVSGVAFFAIPARMLALYGAPPLSVLESILAQTLGAVMVGLGVVCWASRSRAEDRGPLMLGLITTSALWSAVCVRAGIVIDGNWFFWTEAVGLGIITSLLLTAWRSGGRVE